MTSNLEAFLILAFVVRHITSGWKNPALWAHGSDSVVTSVIFSACIIEAALVLLQQLRESPYLSVKCSLFAG